MRRHHDRRRGDQYIARRSKDPSRDLRSSSVILPAQPNEDRRPHTKPKPQPQPIPARGEGSLIQPVYHPNRNNREPQAVKPLPAQPGDRHVAVKPLPGQPQPIPAEGEGSLVQPVYISRNNEEQADSDNSPIAVKPLPKEPIT